MASRGSKVKKESSQTRKESSKRPAEPASPAASGTPAVPKAEAKGSVGPESSESPDFSPPEVLESVVVAEPATTRVKDETSPKEEIPPEAVPQVSARAADVPVPGSPEGEHVATPRARRRRNSGDRRRESRDSALPDETEDPVPERRARDQGVVRAEVQAPTEVTGVLVAARDVAGKEKERKVKVKRVRKEKVRVTHHRRQRRISWLGVASMEDTQCWMGAGSQWRMVVLGWI